MKPNPAGPIDLPKAVGFRGEVQAHWRHYLSLGVVCLVVMGLWVWNAAPGAIEYWSQRPENAYYNLLVQGFQSGQLNLKTEVPPGLARFASPYDPNADVPDRWINGHPLHDTSLYKGKLYLYFGVTPALVLFWPYAVLTGHYLPHQAAVLFFCATGFLAATGLLYGLWRRFFQEAGFGVVLAGTVALGLASGLPVLLSRCEVYQVAIGCGYAFMMLTLAALGCAIAKTSRPGWWLALASLTYGLAVGARPDLLPGAVILLVPVIRAWREGRRIWTLLGAAIGPVVLVGLGLMLYNYLRFDDPLEFGLYYQLKARRLNDLPLFSPHYLWFNVCANLLEPVHWSFPFPFLHGISAPPLPNGHTAVIWPVEWPFGVLTNIPLVWLALAAPLAWRDRSATDRSILRGTLAAIALLFGMCALTLSFYYVACNRYEIEFLPALVLLAVIGILGLERALVRSRFWLLAARGTWGLLLLFSLAFNLLAGFELRAETHHSLGTTLFQEGRAEEAMMQYRTALGISPGLAEAWNSLGIALAGTGQFEEARNDYLKAIQLKPGYAAAYNDLGLMLVASNRCSEAIPYLESALRLQPDYVHARWNLGNALAGLGRRGEAVAQYRIALQYRPDYAEAWNSLGNVYGAEGKYAEAAGCFRAALKITPASANFHCNLGNAYAGQNQYAPAIEEYHEALRLNPGYAHAENNLAGALTAVGKMDEALAHYEAAVRLQPDAALTRYNFGCLLAKAGRQEEAVAQLKEAVRLQRDYEAARKKLQELNR